MPPQLASNQRETGWRAFFALLMLLQVIALGVMWRTYDALQEALRLTALHDYQIREEIRPAIKDLQARRP